MTAFKRIRSKSGTVHFVAGPWGDARIETFCDMHFLVADVAEANDVTTCRYCVAIENGTDKPLSRIARRIKAQQVVHGA